MQLGWNLNHIFYKFYYNVVAENLAFKQFCFNSISYLPDNVKVFRHYINPKGT